MTEFTPAHYFLIGLSACVFASFLIGLAYLLIREQHKGTEARKQQWKNLLQKRRTGISGRPRHPGTSLFEDSTEEWQISSSQSPTTSDTKSVEKIDTPVSICS